MRNYEVAFIAHPEVSEQALTALTVKVQSWVTSGGGALVRTDHWGKRRLAYPIRKQRDGQYVFVYASMPPALCADLERQFRFTEEVLRFMITQAEPPKAVLPVIEPATAGPVLMAPEMALEAEPEVEPALEVEAETEEIE